MTQQYVRDLVDNSDIVLDEKTKVKIIKAVSQILMINNDDQNYAIHYPSVVRTEDSNAPAEIVDIINNEVEVKWDYK